MNIDDVARRMTHGTPRAAFTARVMAPILGRPRPGFTARVMNRLDEPAVAQAFRPAFRAALILVPAAIALAAGVSVLRASRVVTPALPEAPRVSRSAEDASRFTVPALPVDRPVAPTPAARSVAAVASQEATEPPFHVLPALESPSNIAMKSIEPASCTIPALEALAPLKVPDLPANGGGSQSKEFKEKS